MTRLRLSLHDRQDDLDTFGDVVLNVMPSSSPSKEFGDDGALNESRLTDAISS